MDEVPIVSSAGAFFQNLRNKRFALPLRLRYFYGSCSYRIKVLQNSRLFNFTVYFCEADVPFASMLQRGNRCRTMPSQRQMGYVQ